jgi:DNA-binding response OmpR family regulator
VVIFGTLFNLTMALTDLAGHVIMAVTSCHFDLLILVCETMEPYTLLVISRTQSLAERLRSMLGTERYLVRWVPNTAQALGLDLCPALLVFALPPSGGDRSAARLKRRFESPLLALLRTDEQPSPRAVDVSLSRSGRLQQLVELIEMTLIEHSPHMIRAGKMSLDTETRRLQMNGELYQLRPIGCEILALLMARPDEVIARDELFQRAWHTEDGDNTRALDVHVAHLRRELEADPRSPTLILTERGVGYRLVPPV